jgi:hypothetical protein
MIGHTVRQVLAQLPVLSPTVERITWTVYPPGVRIAKRADPARDDPKVYAREALRHRGYPEPIHEASIAELPAIFGGSVNADRVRGVCSRVRMHSGQTAHLPMLDLQCSVSNENERVILAAMRILGEQRGALATSGRSYHYYGFEPREPVDWRRFMTHAILLTPLVDVRYVAHCLLENLACLRVEDHPSYPGEPTVVAELTPV